MGAGGRAIARRQASSVADVQLSHRRRFLRDSACGLGSIALSLLLAEDGYPAASADPLREREPHFEPTARNVIFLLQACGPTQLDLLDPKPSMRRWARQSLPDSLAGDLALAFMQPDA